MNRVKLLLRLADALEVKSPLAWRTSKNGKRFIINTMTGEIVGGSPAITQEYKEGEKRFTKKVLHDNMEKAVKTLVGVSCYEVKGFGKIRIKCIPDHANIRMVERRITPSEVKEALQAPTFTARGNTPDVLRFCKNNIVSVVTNSGALKTCMRVTRGGKLIWPKK